MRAAEIEHLRESWVKDRPSYVELGAGVKSAVSDVMQRKGLKVRVEEVVRSEASLVKMILRDGVKSQAQPVDNLIVRVVVDLQSQIPMVEEALGDVLVLSQREDTSKKLDPYQLGDQSVRYQARLSGGTPGLESFQEHAFEVQVRSICQDLWVQMADSLLYRLGTDVPREVSRRVYALNALLEVCDREFGALHEKLKDMPGAYATTILATLEEYYYQYAGGEYDRALSVQVIEEVRSLIPESEQLLQSLQSWVSAKREQLSLIYEEYHGLSDRWIFLFQPEALLLFYLLDTDKFSLAEAWVERFPFEELEGMAKVWGVTLGE